MSRELSYPVASQADIYPVLAQVGAMVDKGLVAGPVEIAVRRPGQKRSTQANRLMWKLLNDIASQIEWAGTKLEPEDWKDLVSAAMHKQRVLPGLDGGLVAMGQRTSKMRKDEFSDLIESIYAAGAERGVQWSADTTTDWNQYREVAA